MTFSQTLPPTLRRWTIDHYLQDALDGTELCLETLPMPPLADGQVLIKTRLLSIDASNLLWLSERKDYLPPLQIGDAMRGQIIGRVEASAHPAFAAGEHLMTLQSWSDYVVADGEALLDDALCMKLTPHPQLPLDAYMGALGLTGWSAYVGMITVGRVQPGETVLVSGAAGATGMMAAQIAKAAGARVFGLAGGARKCQWLLDTLGLDGAIDYKASDNLQHELATAIPDGIALFFDNVGGETLDAVLPNMAIGGRIVASGSVSQYGRTERYGVRNLAFITTRRLRMEGFLILDYLAEVPTVLQTLEQWFLEGKLVHQMHPVYGLENAQSALPLLRSGGNAGKLTVILDD